MIYFLEQLNGMMKEMLTTMYQLRQAFLQKRDIYLFKTEGTGLPNARKRLNDDAYASTPLLQKDELETAPATETTQPRNAFALMTARARGMGGALSLGTFDGLNTACVSIFLKDCASRKVDIGSSTPFGPQIHRSSVRRAKLVYTRAMTYLQEDEKKSF